MLKEKIKQKKRYISQRYYSSILPANISNFASRKELIYFAKDNFWTKDFSATASSDFLTNFFPGCNATVIKLLDKKKFILFGKTFLDEFACGGTGLYANTGPIFNPHNSSHIIGGSSSGSAGVVVEGLVSFALGSDTGGSIRHPAAYVGIVGFKPSASLISRFGLLPMASSLDTVGILANSVATTQKIFSVLAQPDVSDLLTIIRKNLPLQPSFSTKKVTVLKGIEKYLSPILAQLYQKTLVILKNQGYQIEVIEIPRNIRENLQIYWLIICFSELVSHLNSLQGVTYGVKKDTTINQKRRGKLGKIVQQRLLIGAYFLQNQEILEAAYLGREKVKKWIDKIFRKYGFLIFPSTNSPAPKVNKIKDKKPFNKGDQNAFVSLGSETHWSDNLLLLANFAGLPSLSLPIGLENNLPVSININGAPGNDKSVLKVAELLEKEIDFKL